MRRSVLQLIKRLIGRGCDSYCHSTGAVVPCIGFSGNRIDTSTVIVGIGYPLHSGPAHILWSLTSNASEWGGENRLWGRIDCACPAVSPHSSSDRRLTRRRALAASNRSAMAVLASGFSKQIRGRPQDLGGYLSQMDTPLVGFSGRRCRQANRLITGARSGKVAHCVRTDLRITRRNRRVQRAVIA